MKTLAITTAVGLVLSAGLAPTPVDAQPGGAALNVSRIFHNGPLKVGENTFRVTVRNASTNRPTPPREPVVVTLTVLDPRQKKTEYQGEIRNGIGPNGDQTAAIPGVRLEQAGAHTITAVAFVPDKPGRPALRSADKSQVFNVGGAEAAGAYQLIVLARNQRNAPAQGLRVALKTREGRELDWKRTGGTGEARFPRVAPSPQHGPYTIEIKSGARVVGSYEFAMPAQNAVYEASTDMP